jgi:prophage DNA circulation protein
MNGVGETRRTDRSLKKCVELTVTVTVMLQERIRPAASLTGDRMHGVEHSRRALQQQPTPRVTGTSCSNRLSLHIGHGIVVNLQGPNNYVHVE